MIISTANIEMSSTRKYECSRTDAYAYSSARMSAAKASTVVASSKEGDGGFLPTLNYKLLKGGSSDVATDTTTKGANAPEKSNLSKLMSDNDAKVRYQTLLFLFKQLFAHRMGGDYSCSMETLATDYLNNSSLTVETMDHLYSYSESETTTFSTTGTVVTEDGRELSFGVEIGMSRSFRAEFTESCSWIQNPSLDPLVINLEGDVADVSDQKFFFDLDQDGEDEYISKLAKGSGFLALDKNNDGIINDGSELFGTKSGDGFGDLALYDEDGNGWIDEADEIFDKLRIWCFDENGNGELYGLKESGVGAICLNRIATKFSLNDDFNNNHATIQETGLFLFESGKAGTVQHLDLAT